jgi:tRNA(fMet)-specific endonuclease VapC
VYVLDTNTLIYFFKGLGNVGQNLLATAPKDIGIPAVVLYELQYGIEKSTQPRKRKNQLRELCSVVDVLPFSTREAEVTGAIRAALERKGTPIGPYDVMIAATTICCQGTLVTNNTKEFKRVPGLKIVNWY